MEVYVTRKMSPRMHNLTLDELWFGDDNATCWVKPNATSTFTVLTSSPPSCDREDMIRALNAFYDRYKDLIDTDKGQLYRTFYVPKSSGGLRRIDAPNDQLSNALRDLIYVFKTWFNASYLYHTSAFAYINGRSNVTCIKKHQQNQSKWFGKFDIHNFFGSTTIDFVMQMFSMIWPFSEICGTVHGNELLRSVMSLCFLNGVLPQGTPISPLIINIMMIPVDYSMERFCRDKGMIYTRYADDFIISSRHQFRFREVETFIEGILSAFEAPFSLNKAKTRYGSSSGSNWNLGIMLNKDNQMTIGRAKKRQFESMMAAYAKDKKNGREWSLEDVQHLEGLKSYYKMIEGDTIERIIDHISTKQGVDIRSEIKKDLRK